MVRRRSSDALSSSVAGSVSVERPEKADGAFRSRRRSACGADDNRALAELSELERTVTRSIGITTVSCATGTSRACVPPASRKSSRHAGFRRLGWRDPDSNRGHHDFQDSARKCLTSRNPCVALVSAAQVRMNRLSLFANVCGTIGYWVPREYPIAHGCSDADENVVVARQGPNPAHYISGSGAIALSAGCDLASGQRLSCRGRGGEQICHLADVRRFAWR
jgi:hypothetical protein